MTPKKRVLILCTGNSCRSQMAQAIWDDIGGQDWVADSAGSCPAGSVHPLAIRVLEEIGLSGAGLRSKSTEEFQDQEIDLAITVCDNAKASCPVLPGVDQTFHWPFDDPAEARGTEAEKLAVFRRVREEIRAKIKSFLDRKSN